MSYKRFNVSMPPDLAEKLADAAASEYISRSEYIRESVMMRLELGKMISAEQSDKDSMLNAIQRNYASRAFRMVRHKLRYKRYWY